MSRPMVLSLRCAGSDVGWMVGSVVIFCQQDDNIDISVLLEQIPSISCTDPSPLFCTVTQIVIQRLPTYSELAGERRFFLTKWQPVGAARLRKNYAQKIWTQHEYGSALKRSLEDSECILPARLDDTPIVGISTTIALDLRMM